MIMLWASLAGFINLIALYFRIPKKQREWIQNHTITQIIFDMGMPLLVLAGMFSAPNLAVVVIALTIGAMFDVFLWRKEICGFFRRTWRYATLKF